MIFSKAWRIFAVGGMNRSGVIRNRRIWDVFLKKVQTDSKILTRPRNQKDDDAIRRGCCGLSVGVKHLVNTKGLTPSLG